MAAVLVVELRAVGGVVDVTVIVVEVRAEGAGSEAFGLGLLAHPPTINTTRERLTMAMIRVEVKSTPML